MSTATWRASDALTVDGGIQIERQKNLYQRYRYAFAVPTQFSNPRTPPTTTATRSTTWGVRAGHFRATDKLKIIPGLRLDQVLGPPPQPQWSAGALQDYGWIKQPKLSMVYPVNDATSVYANWGRTFQILTGSRAPASRHIRQPGHVCAIDQHRHRAGREVSPRAPTCAWPCGGKTPPMSGQHAQHRHQREPG